MNRIALMTSQQRTEVFAETAAQMGVADAIVEKDFWVCWMLKQLFSINALRGRLLFKGGTSLSKVFHAINRFSEDIDLGVDYAALGFVGDRDPQREDISRSKRNTILADMLVACQQYIATEFIELAKNRCDEILGAGDSWSLTIDEEDPHIVRFRYPTAANALPYVRSQVVLELGTHAEFVPHGTFTIRSFVVEQFPNLAEDGEVTVEALLAKRTFWEKATILHAEYYRPEAKALPNRYSRHYYDLAMMAAGPIKTEALEDKELLEQVVRHKQTFYPSAWARYDLARVGSLRLIPTEERLASLQQDYRLMDVMIFAEPPDFSEVMTTLTNLEREINRSM